MADPDVIADYDVSAGTRTVRRVLGVEVDPIEGKRADPIVSVLAAEEDTNAAGKRAKSAHLR